MGFNKFRKTDGIRILLVVSIIAIVYLSAGSQIWTGFKQIVFRMPEPPPTTTPTNVSTPSPTKTPTLAPTSTYTPSPTLIPTNTYTPTPIQTSLFLSGEAISFWNEFDSTDPLRGDWVFFPNAKVENGLLIIEKSDDWSGVYGNSHLQDEQTILMQFRFDNWSDIHIAVETGEFGSDSYRSWGVGAEYNIFSPIYSEGTLEFDDSFTPVEDLELDPGKWYVLMLHIGGTHPFVARIWEYTDPTEIYNAQVEMNETWVGQEWLPYFLVGPVGKLEIERYEELREYIP